MNRSDVIVYVSGGVVQGVIGNADGLRVMIVDYDNEDGFEEKQKHRAFESVERDDNLFEKILAGVEE